MNIFDYALANEAEGEKLYRELALSAPSEGFRAIFQLLADEESNHARLIENLRKLGPAMECPQFPPLIKSSVILQTMPSLTLQECVSSDEIAVYQRALSLEVESETNYLKMAQEAATPQGRALLLRIAAEEKMHQFLLDGVLQVLQSTPVVELDSSSSL